MSDSQWTDPAERPIGTIDSPGAASTTPTKEVAADQARGVAEDAKASGQQVAETAKDQAATVVNEARVQAKQVYDQARRDLTDQAAVQHQRAASGLHSLADELNGLTTGTAQQGMATDLIREGATKARELATWLEDREPGDVLNEVTRYARRRPGAFLLGAAVLGLVGGRVTRSLADDARDDSPAEVGQRRDTTLTEGHDPAYRDVSDPLPGLADRTPPPAAYPPVVRADDAGERRP